MAEFSASHTPLSIGATDRNQPCNAPGAPTSAGDRLTQRARYLIECLAEGQNNIFLRWSGVSAARIICETVKLTGCESGVNGILPSLYVCNLIASSCALPAP